MFSPEEVEKIAERACELSCQCPHATDRIRVAITGEILRYLFSFDTEVTLGLCSDDLRRKMRELGWLPKEK